MTHIPVSKPLPRGFLKHGAGIHDDVEAARQAVLAEKETATTVRGGTRVPSWVEKSPATRGQGGNTPAVQPIVQHQQLATVEEDFIIEEAEAIANPQPAPTPAPQPRAARPPVATPAPVQQQSEPNLQRQRLEDPEGRFVGEIYRNGKDWIAEITYAGTAGKEVFKADSKDQLLLKMVAGKANATLRIRSAVRREKVAVKPDGWDFFYAKVKESHKVSKQEFDALPEASRALIQDAIQAVQIQEWLGDFPEYKVTPENFKTLVEFLNKNKWPLTRTNLGIAYRDLVDEGKLEVNKATPTAVPSRAAATRTAAPSVPVAIAPAPVQPTVVPVAVAPRKRGYGALAIMPGSSSASPTERVRANESREMTEAELRALPISEHRRLAIPQLNQPASRRRS